MVSSELLTYLILQYTIDKVDAQIVIKWTPLSESVWLVACGFYTYVYTILYMFALLHQQNSKVPRPSKLEKSTAGAWGLRAARKATAA